MTVLILLASDDLIPFRTLGDGQLRLDNDFALLTYQAQIAREFFTNTGRLWDYEPFFLAGHVDPFIWNSNVNFQVFAVLFSFLSLPTVVKTYTLFLFLLIPFLLVSAGRRMDRQNDPALSALLFGLLGVGLFQISLLAKLFHTAMISTAFVMILSLYLLFVFLQFLEKNQKKEAVILCLLAPIALLVHKKAIFTLGLPALILLIAYRRRVSRTHLLWLSAAAALTLLVNLFWLWPLLKLGHLAMFDISLNHWHNLDPLAFLRDLIDPHAKVGVFNRPTGWPSLVFRWLLYLSAILGIRQRWRLNDRNLTAGYGAAWILIYLFAYFGSFVPGLFRLDPSGFVLYAELMALVPATWFVQSLCLRVSKAKRLLAIVAIMHFALLPTILPPLHPFSSDKLDQYRNSTQKWEQLAKRITQTKQENGRVLLETYNIFHAERDRFAGDNTDHSLFAHLLFPYLTKAPFVGGHYPNFFVEYNRANFYSGILAKRPLEKWRARELEQFLNAYQIELIVAHTPIAKKTFGERLANVEPLWREGPHQAYRYRLRGDYFVQGGGNVSFDYGRIVLNNLQANENGSVVIKLHHVPGLRASDDSVVEPVEVEGAVLPFIRIKPKSRNLILSR